MKNIAFVIPQIGKGGAERVVVNLANQLSRNGFDVAIYTILSGEVNYRLEEHVEHIYIDENSRNKLIRVIRRFIKLRKMLRNSGADTIVAFDRTYGMSCALGSGKRVIASERNDPYSNMGVHSFEKYYRDYVYRKADMVVFQTRYAQDYFSQTIKSHSCIIPNPVTNDILPHPYQGVRERTVVTASRLTTQKNLPLLMKAFSRFRASHNDFKLIIYGEGPLREKLEAISKKLEIENFVSFEGFVDDLPKRISKAGMYVSSSDYEGISNSMLEALAMGIPTICTDCPAGGAAMVIDNGVNGVLVPVGNDVCLYESMCMIADDCELAEKLSREAVKVRDKYSINRITQMWEEVL